MCTLILVWRAFEETPVLVAANRDEKLDRPAEGPTIRSHRGRRFVAPTDLSAGGTWLGVNDTETFVGITNRFIGEKRAHVRSRGLLVLDALAAGDARTIDAELGAMDPAPYDGFHLLFADREAAFVLWSDGSELHRIVLSPGITVLTERSFGAAETEREALIRRLLNAPEQAPSDDDLKALLATRVADGFESVEVSVPEHGYGTRSSTIYRLGRSTGDARLLHASGPPSRTAFEDLSDLLGRLS